MSPLKEYKEKALKAIVVAAQTVNMRTSTLTSTLDSIGLPTEVVFSGTDFTLPEVTESTTIKGRPRSEFTDEALAAHEAEELAAYQRALYDGIKFRTDRNYLPRDVAIKLLGELGLPTPTVQTHIDASVAGFGHVSTVVPGELSEDEVRTKLETLASQPVEDGIRSVFPDAKGLHQPVTGLSVVHSPLWPPFKAS